MRINESGKFFWLTIFSGFLDIPQETRYKFAQEIDIQKSKNPNKKFDETESTWTGDVNNHSAIHTNPVFNPFFSQVKNILELYCEEIGIRHHLLDFYISRSWGTVSIGKQEIAPHDHGYSNITIVYYPKLPDDCGELRLSPHNHHNEIIHNLFNDEGYIEGVVDGHNYHVSRNVNIQPTEDLFVIFPAKTPHATSVSSPNANPRYSIAVDVVVTLKNINKTEYALPPITQWSKV